VQAFAEFGFARAHAAAFAKISYDTAWLKRNYPAHYTVGVLNNQPMGFYSPASSSTTPSATGSGSCRSTSTSRPGSTTRDPPTTSRTRTPSALDCAR
jgi:error-prone DNA polymerase